MIHQIFLVLLFGGDAPAEADLERHNLRAYVAHRALFRAATAFTDSSQ